MPPSLVSVVKGTGRMESVLVKTTTSHLISPTAQASRLAYKINECAALIGVSHQTIRRAIARGDIRVSRKTRHVLIPRAELERFIAA